MSDKMKDLKKRVEQFQMLQLPGQMGVHMGTSYLIGDLWRELEKLYEEKEKPSDT